METIYQSSTKISGRRIGTDRRRFTNPGYKGPERRIVKDRRGNQDQRRQKRYRVRDLTFVRLCSGSKEDMGQMLDISKGGLSLRYFVNVEKSRNYNELDIFMSGDNFKIKRLPFKSISDILLANRSPFSPTILKRSGIQFGKLTPDQASGLDYFISNYTLGET